MIDLRDRDRRPELARQRAEAVRQALTFFSAGVGLGVLLGIAIGVLFVKVFGR